MPGRLSFGERYEVGFWRKKVKFAEEDVVEQKLVAVGPHHKFYGTLSLARVVDEVAVAGCTRV